MFDGGRLELLKKAKTLTIRQRLEAMDELFKCLSACRASARNR